MVKYPPINARDTYSIPGSGRLPWRRTWQPTSVLLLASLLAQMVKNLPAMQQTEVRSLDQKDLLEQEMATHSSILAWRIPWTEEPGRPQSTGSQRVGHDVVTKQILRDAPEKYSPPGLL